MRASRARDVAGNAVVAYAVVEERGVPIELAEKSRGEDLQRISFGMRSPPGGKPSLDELRRHFRLSESELRDYCSDIMDDGFDEPMQDSGSGY